jgi:hypothetical protein
MASLSASSLLLLSLELLEELELELEEELSSSLLLESVEELSLLLLSPEEPTASSRRVMVPVRLPVSCLRFFLRRETWGFSSRDCFRARRRDDMMINLPALERSVELSS